MSAAPLNVVFLGSDPIALPFKAKVTYMGRTNEMLMPQTDTHCARCHTPTGASNAADRNAMAARRMVGTGQRMSARV